MEGESILRLMEDGVAVAGDQSYLVVFDELEDMFANKFGVLPVRLQVFVYAKLGHFCQKRYDVLWILDRLGLDQIVPPPLIV